MWMVRACCADTRMQYGLNMATSLTYPLHIQLTYPLYIHYLTSFFVVKTFKMYFLGDFRVCNTLLLARVSMRDDLSVSVTFK